jgi:hypothetical protein
MSKGKCGVIISTFVARTLALKAVAVAARRENDEIKLFTFRGCR